MGKKIINDNIGENKINIIMRLLSIIYHGTDKIDISMEFIKQKNIIDQEAEQLIKNKF